MRPAFVWRQLLAVCFGLIITSAISAQSYTPTLPDNMLTPADPIGIPPRSSSVGTNESVGLSNGSLNVFIPALSLPQRGGWNLTLGYVHHGPNWSMQQNITINSESYGNYGWGDRTNFTNLMTNYPNHALQLNLPRLRASIEYVGTQVNNNSVPPTYIQSEFPVFCVMNWVFTDWSGNSHPFSNIAQCSSERCTTSLCHSIPGQVSNLGDSTDGAWLRLDTSNKSDIRVFTKDGTVYHFTDFVDPYPGAPTGSNYSATGNIEAYYQGTFAAMVDPHGNTVSLQNNILTDTIGRQISLANGISYKDSTGNPQTINLNTTTSSTKVNYSFPNLWCEYAGQSYPAPFVTPTITTYNNTFNLAPFTIDIVFPPSDSTGTNRAYHMQFDGLDRMTQINYPSGGYTRYDYQDLAADQYTDVIHCRRDFVQVAHKYESPSGSAAQEFTTTYLPGIGSGTTPSNGVIDVVDPAGTRAHHVFSTPKYSQLSPVETDESIYNSAGTLLRSVHTDYTPVFNFADFQLPTTLTTTLNDVSPAMVSKEVRLYDSTTVAGTPNFNGKSVFIDNPIEIDEYDFGASTPTKKTAQTWAPSTNFTAPHMLDRLASRTVTDSASNVQSTLSYGYNTVGDVTSKSVGGTGVTTLTTNYQRDAYGNITQLTDPKQNVTKFGYVDNWAQTTCAPSSNSSAYLTSVTDALNHVTSLSYNSCTGSKASATDPNGAKTSVAYDALGRTVSTTLPGGGQTTKSYVDAIPNNVTSTSLITSSVSNISKTIVDGFGRVTQTQLNSDPDGVTYVDTTYDAMGRVHSVSNPYRSTTENTYGVTSSFYDALDRTCLVVPPDGTLPTGSNCPSSQPSNTIFTTYSGATTTVTDQAGNSRKSVTDALGRLTQVFEDPAGLNYETDYSYDALGNLLTVNQKGGTTDSTQWRARNFTYDSLSRLLTANNPESGTVSYTYDANGNLIYKTSPAPNQTGSATVTLTYCYDALNRLTAKAYTQQTCTNGTVPSPAATYLYDQASYNGLTITNGIGRRTGMTDSAGSEAWSYDSMGRIATDRRTTNGVTKSFPYTYNLDGSIASDYIITYTQGSGGRYTSAGNSGYALAYNLKYAPNGSMCYMNSAWGNTFTHIWTFNNRFQPVAIQLYGTGHGSSPSPCTVSTDTTGEPVDLVYSFTDANGHNNGNVVSITNISGGNDGDGAQNFTYDSLNRIASAQTSAINQPGWSGDTGYLQECWAEQYSYDAWGNLVSIAPSSSSQYTGCSQESGFNFTGAIGTNNRIIASGYAYDSAGNLIVAPPTGTTYNYDAENHLISTGGQTYFYDGDGKRVEKASGSPLAANKIYWYGNNTAPLVETDGAGNFQYAYFYFNGILFSRQEWNWIDHYGLDALGNVRWMYGYNGAWDISDYYPFGGERVVQPNSNNSRKFTGKERDSESGLDNFGARYNSSNMGRFMSPDWSASPEPVPYAKLDDPQSLNLYAYARK